MLVLRDLLNIKFKIGVKTKSRLFKKIAEILLLVPGDVFKLIFHNSLNISIFSMLIEQIGSWVLLEYSVFGKFNEFWLYVLEKQDLNKLTISYPLSLLFLDSTLS